MKGVTLIRTAVSAHRELVSNFTFLLILSLCWLFIPLWAMAGDSLTPVSCTIAAGDCTATGSPSSLSPRAVSVAVENTYEVFFSEVPWFRLRLLISNKLVWRENTVLRERLQRAFTRAKQLYWTAQYWPSYPTSELLVRLNRFHAELSPKRYWREVEIPGGGGKGRLYLKPVLNNIGRSVSSPNILRTVRPTTLRFLTRLYNEV